VLCDAVGLLDMRAALAGARERFAGGCGRCRAGRVCRRCERARRLDDVPALRVAIDGDRLTLVLLNLMDNAVKHGKPGGGVFVGIDVDDSCFVRLTVDDDGTGDRSRRPRARLCVRRPRRYGSEGHGSASRWRASWSSVREGAWTSSPHHSEERDSS
jgi:histidine kinase/DNA gyrase B/HSP90-like ATPase